VVRIEKMLQHDAPLPHPSRFEHILGGAMESYAIWQELDLEPHWEDCYINIPQERNKFACTRLSLTHEWIWTNTCISKGMLVNVHKYGKVVGETLGLMDFGVYMEEIHGNCETCRIVDEYIIYLVDGK